jgi:2-oxoglutarate ferredoxin oxidoreductase subunit alpha
MSKESTAAENGLHLENSIIRFAGDSGDGIQTTGAMFSHDSALLGHDVSTMPDFPAEIRAPAGTLAGVSSFQLNFSSYDIHTPGDRPDVLVALNPAALKAHLEDLVAGGMIIFNEDAFTAQDIKKAGYDEDPRESGALTGYQLFPVPVTSLTLEAVKPTGLGKKQATQCKNIFTLGLVCWLYDRPTQSIEQYIDSKFSEKDEQVAKANRLALLAGYFYADTVELFSGKYYIGEADLEPGTYRRISGNEALAMGCLAASELSNTPLFYGSYPITPASDILHELSRLRHFGVRTFQAEDEIAAMGAAIGAAYGGALALTGTSGPGLALKSEAIGLAVMTELPVVIINVQRGGPSTGLPTKTEQADLLQAMYGRNGECPLVVLAPRSPGDCFAIAVEAFRIAVKYMTPVIILSDGYIANGSEPWRVPEAEELQPIPVVYHRDTENFLPYGRDEVSLSRPWVIPGTPGLEHQIGGIEKEDGSGEISYDSHNHERMVTLREQKIRGVAADVPALEVFGPERGDLLVLGWGSTYGAIRHAVENVQQRGYQVACTALRHLNPWPLNLGEVLGRYERVLVPELNRGQLRQLLRAEFLLDINGLNKVQGQPFKTSEIETEIERLLAGNAGEAA